MAGNEMLSYDGQRYGINGLDWGIWQLRIGGDYTGQTSDIWDFSMDNCAYTWQAVQTGAWLDTNTGVGPGTFSGTTAGAAK